MSEILKTINLPLDLKERRKLLQQELKETVVEQVTGRIKSEITTSLAETDVKITSISWDFYPESDDEGGSVYYPEGISISTEEDIDPDEFMIKVESSYSDDIYEYSLDDIIREILCDNSSDLYDYDVYEIQF